MDKVKRVTNEKNTGAGYDDRTRIDEHGSDGIEHTAGVLYNHELHKGSSEENTDTIKRLAKDIVTNISRLGSGSTFNLEAVIAEIERADVDGVYKQIAVVLNDDQRFEAIEKAIRAGTYAELHGEEVSTRVFKTVRGLLDATSPDGQSTKKWKAIDGSLLALGGTSQVFEKAWQFAPDVVASSVNDGEVGPAMEGHMEAGRALLNEVADGENEVAVGLDVCKRVIDARDKLIGVLQQRLIQGYTKAEDAYTEGTFEAYEGTAEDFQNVAETSLSEYEGLEKTVHSDMMKYSGDGVDVLAEVRNSKVVQEAKTAYEAVRQNKQAERARAVQDVLQENIAQLYNHALHPRQPA